MQAHERIPLLDQRLAHQTPQLCTFSCSGIVIGIVIGSLNCITNIYFGLKTGQISASPIAAAFFTILISKSLKLGLNPAEIMFAVTISTAMGIMSLAGGFVGPIPALTQLLDSKTQIDNRMKFSWLQLAIFAVALSGFGPIFALLMRGQFLGVSERRELPFPTATATAQIIIEYADTDGDTIVDPVLAPEEQPETANPSGGELINAGPPDSETGNRNWVAGLGIAIPLIYVSIFLLSAALTFSIPTGPGAPYFFRLSSTYSDWIEVSPGLVGQGFIMGPQIAYETLLGAMFAKIILPWILHLKFWIFADADGEQGADVVRIWALWLGLVVMLADSFFKILWSLWEAVRPLFQDKEILPPIQARPSMDSSTTPEAILIPTTDTDSRVVRTNTANTAVQSKSLSSIIPKPILGLALIALTPVCIFALWQCIGKFVPWIEALVAISLALPLCYVSILATGRSDYTPASALGRFSQIFVACFDSSSVRYAVIVNIAMGAVVESAACQAATMISKLKAGAAVGADPKMLFWGHLLGSLVGALVASGVFQYLMGARSAGSDHPSNFKMPGAHMFLMTAKLALNTGLPKHAYWGAALLGGTFCATAALKEWGADAAWVKWIPSGTAFATGMYNVPAVAIDWCMGSLVGHQWAKRGDKTAVTLFGSGLMVGESLSHLILGWFA